MGFFNSIGQMFDGKPGSPIEDWLRQQGVMGPAAANGTVNPDGGTQPLFGDRPPQTTPGYGDSVASSVGGGASSPRGLFANGRKPNSLGAGIPEVSPQLPANTSNAPLSVAETAGIEQSRVGRGMTAMEGGRGKLGGIDLQAALADNAMKTPPKKRGGFNFRDFALAWVGGPEMAYRIRKDREESNLKAEQAERLGVIRSQAYNHLVYDKGVHPARAELMVQNHEKLAEEWATSQRTRDMAPGHTVYTPGENPWTAPKTFEMGRDVYEYDPENGAQHLFSGRTDAQTYADTLGIDPNSPDYNKALQDYVLRGNGPTALWGKDYLQDQRLQQSDTNNRRTVGASIGNNIRSTSTSRANNIRSTSTSRQNNQANNATRQGAYSYKNGGGRSGRSGAGGAATARGPNGEVITFNGRNWVDARGKVIS